MDAVTARLVAIRSDAAPRLDMRTPVLGSLGDRTDYNPSAPAFARGHERRSPTRFPGWGFATIKGQRPTLPPGLPDSTIGAGGLNFSVRNGKRCFPSASATPIQDDNRTRRWDSH